ncbi:protein translocase subunit SecF [bacterium]|nr:protein translocase subunit SecF [bacterium]
MSIDRKIDFIGKSKTLLIVSAVLVGLSIILCFVLGFNFGIDFTGGTEMQIRAEGVSIDTMREILKPYNTTDIQQFEGKSNEYLVRFKNISTTDDATINSFISAVGAKFSDAKILKTHFDSQVGDRIEIWFDKDIDTEALTELAKTGNVPILDKDFLKYNKVGDRSIYRLMLKGLTYEIVNVINQANPSSEADLVRVELVGPKVGEKLRFTAIQAVLYSLIAILIYIAFRFNFQFAPGAVIALFHDVMIALGIWAVFRIPFDLTIVAALLTIVGYSINDTIVIYDRIRENLNNQNAGRDLAEKMNTSLNETLSRTLLTSVTTLLSTLALLVFGGEIIRGFALMMSIGVIVGSYSSLFVAAPLTLLFEHMKNRGNAA